MTHKKIQIHPHMLVLAKPVFGQDPCGVDDIRIQASIVGLHPHAYRLAEQFMGGKEYRLAQRFDESLKHNNPIKSFGEKRWQRLQELDELMSKAGNHQDPCYRSYFLVQSYFLEAPNKPTLSGWMFDPSVDLPSLTDSFIEHLWHEQTEWLSRHVAIIHEVDITPMLRIHMKQTKPHPMFSYATWIALPFDAKHTPSVYAQLLSDKLEQQYLNERTQHMTPSDGSVRLPKKRL